MPVLGSRRIWRKRWTQKAVALIGAEYFRFVFRTNRPVVPEQLYAHADPDLPIILVMWHGQHFLAPFIRRPTDKCKVLISHHSDGEITTLTAKRLGVDVIRGSGDPHGASTARAASPHSFKWSRRSERAARLRSLPTFPRSRAKPALVW